MPKADAAGKRRRAREAVRRTPLAQEILQLRPDAAEVVAQLEENRRPKKEEDEEPEVVDGLIAPSTTEKILRLADEQQWEEDSVLSAADSGSDIDYDEDAKRWLPTPGECTEAENFMLAPKEAQERTLGDLLKHATEVVKKQMKLPTSKEDVKPKESSKILEMYQEIGTFLSKYRSGRVPKAFKIVPRLKNWEEILCATNPLDWTPNAMYEATRIFASNLNPKMAQRFYNLVLLPAVRGDIAATKKLNYHYYRSLKKAMFKPAAWFKGILFPLVLDGCSLRETVILGSVLSKVSIPPQHIAAALIRLGDLHQGDTSSWSSATSYFICVLLNKRCALPRLAVSSTVKHFAEFLNDERALPVIWHRSLLTLVQRYKLDLDANQRKTLREVLKKHNHHALTPEIRKELQHADRAVEWMQD